MKVNLSILIFMSCLAACLSNSARAEQQQVKQVEEKPVIQFKEGTQGRASFLKTTKARYDTPNSKIGELQKGWFCSKSGDIV